VLALFGRQWLAALRTRTRTAAPVTPPLPFE